MAVPDFLAFPRRAGAKNGDWHQRSE